MINSLYYGADTPPALDLSISSETMRRALQTIYRDDFGGADIEPELFRAVFGPLSSAIDDAFPEIPGRDEDFVNALCHSAEVFSAFKVHRAQSDMARRLLDSNGDLKPFEQWSREVMPIASHQFGPWLRTEYDTAVIRAQNAADWRRFEQYRDVLPNLRWVPSTSVNPGADHLPYWGTVLPIDHPFWSRHHPGDRWNCKCSLEATDEEPTGVPENPDAKPLQPQRGLEGNPGKSAKLFDLKHPYFPDSCSECPFNRGFKNRVTTLFNKQKDCCKCQQVAKAIPKTDITKITDNRELYEAAKSHPDYTHALMDKKSGGVIALHGGHNKKSPIPKKLRRGREGSTADLRREFIMADGNRLELCCAHWLMKCGHRVVLLNESEQHPTKEDETLSAVDMQLDGVKMDIKSIVGNSNYSWALTSKNAQACKYNRRTDITETVSSVCLYFPNPEDFSESKLKESLPLFYTNLNEKSLSQVLQKIYIVRNGCSDILTYEI